MNDNEPAWEDILVQIADGVGRIESHVRNLAAPPDYRGKLNDLREEAGRSAELISRLVSAVNENNRGQHGFAAELKEHSEVLRLSTSALKDGKADHKEWFHEKHINLVGVALIWMALAGIGGFVYGHWFVSPADFGSAFLTEEKCARAGGEWHQPQNHNPYCLIQK
jgi:hypothetical protein